MPTGGNGRLDRSEFNPNPEEAAPCIPTITRFRRNANMAVRPPIIFPCMDWFDASKTTLAHFTHRSINHHHEGIREAVRHFGPAIVNADGVAVSVETLALQHLAEDMSIIPSAADWLRQMELPLTGGPIRLPAAAPSAAELAAASARHFNTDPAAMFPLHDWFLETAAWFADARHFAMRHHSFGIFEAVIWTDQPPLGSPTVKAPKEGEAWP